MKFNEGQQKFIDKLNGAALVVASAGSGKSSSTVERVRVMVQEKGINPNDILVTTFTRNSAEDLTNKLAKLGVEGVQCGTFHSVCGKILSKLRMFGKEVRRYEVDNIFSKIVLTEKPNFNEIWSWISYQKNYGKTPNSEEFIYKHLETIDVGTARRCFQAYEDYKTRNNMMDMDDVLTKTLALFKADKDDYLDAFKVNYLIIDEAQDLCVVQHELAHYICRTNNITIVGDEKQSLYAFRAASPQKFLEFKDVMPDCEIIHFNVNYRSCKNIVDHANVFSSRYLNSDVYVDAVASNQNEGEIKHKFFYTPEEEANYVCNQIKEKIDNGVQPKDIAVLYRLNEMSQLIELKLKELEVPYYVDSSSAFFKIKEIDSILCVLRLIENKEDDLAFEKLYNDRLGSFKYMPANLINEIKSIANRSGISYLEASENTYVDKKDWINKNFRRFAIAIDTFRNKKGSCNIKSLVEDIIDLLDIETCIRTNIYYDDEKKDSRMNALKVLKGFVDGNRSIDSLLTFAYSDQKKKKKEDTNDNAVQLLTIHKSKGLEFKNVYLIGNGGEGKFPSKQAPIQDEACLFYVGVTRGIDNLYLSSVEIESEFIEAAYRDVMSEEHEQISCWEE